MNNSEHVYYFAYGSCMDQASLSSSLGIDVSACFKGTAFLKGYKLTFNYASVTENVCFANIAIQPDQHVEGGLFHLPVDVLPQLDKREGVSSSRYGRYTVNVEHDGNEIEVLTYHGLVTLPFEASPSLRYINMLEQGLLDACVSQSYKSATLAHISRLPQRSDIEEGN